MSIERFSRNLVVGSLFLCVSGCAAIDGASSSLSEDERLLRQQNSQLQRNVLQGSLAGAAVGGVLGYVFGGDTKSALLGAGAGAVAGGAGGYYVTKRQQSFANEEERVASMTADVEADNEKLKEYVMVAERVIASDKAKLQEIERQYAANQLSLEEANKQAEQIKNNREIIAETIDGLKEKKNNYVYALEQTKEDDSSHDLAAMDQEVEQLEQQIAQLETELDELSNALSVSRVG